MKNARYTLRIFQMSQGLGKFQGIKIRASLGSSQNLFKLDALINPLTGNHAPLQIRQSFQIRQSYKKNSLIKTGNLIK